MSEKVKKKKNRWRMLEVEEYDALLAVLNAAAIEIETLKMEIQNIYKVIEEIKNVQQNS